MQCALREKNTAYRLKKPQPFPEHDLDFSRARSNFKSTVNTKYRSYLLSLVHDFKDNLKRFWSFLKSLKSSRHRPATLVHNGRSASNVFDCANIFNATFGSKFSDPDVDTPPDAAVLSSSSLNHLSVPPGKIQTLHLFFVSPWPMLDNCSAVNSALRH